MKSLCSVLVSTFLAFLFMGPMTSFAQDTQDTQGAQDPQEEIQNLLNIAQNSEAKLEKPSGKAYPILTANRDDFAKFAQDLHGLIGPFILLEGEENESIQVFQIYTSAWQKLGYSLDATIFETYQGISSDQYMWLLGTGRTATFLHFDNIFKNENELKKALTDGIVSRASVVAYLESTRKLMQSISALDKK